MRLLTILLALATPGFLWGQGSGLATRMVEHFEVAGSSRLVALARLGELEHASLLVEAGNLEFLQEPITLAATQQTLSKLIRRVVAGPEEYKVIERGRLLVVVPGHPSRAINRLLTVPLGPYSSQAKSISELNPFLGYVIEAATGCETEGYMWAGPPLDLDIPSFSLSSATFEDVVAKVAQAPEPTMWVVAPDSGRGGCLEGAASFWEVGFYNSDLARPSVPFRQSAGPELVK